MRAYTTNSVPPVTLLAKNDAEALNVIQDFGLVCSNLHSTPLLGDIEVYLLVCATSAESWVEAVFLDYDLAREELEKANRGLVGSEYYEIQAFIIRG